MAKKKQEEEIEEIEIVEEVQGEFSLEEVSGVESFVNENKSYIAIILLVIIGGGGGWYYWNTSQKEAELNAELDSYKAEYFWQRDSMRLAIEGDEIKDVKGLQEIADEYAGTKQENLANYRIGVALMNEGNFEEAIEKLKQFKSDDELVQPAAYRLIGDAYSELQDTEQAIAYYKKAAESKSNDFTVIYLEKLAHTYEDAGQVDKAMETYNKILSDYPATELDQVVLATKRSLAKLESKQ